jgi:hypothetical protein
MIPHLAKWHATKEILPIICHVVLTNTCTYRCTVCFSFFASCPIRPRLSFPLKNFIQYRVLKKTGASKFDT